MDTGITARTENTYVDWSNMGANELPAVAASVSYLQFYIPVAICSWIHHARIP
jgi:hypothetical protein